MILELFRWWGHLALRRAGGERFCFSSGAVELTVHRFGPEEGEPWLLLHGMGATAATTWAPLVRRLSSEAHLLAPEMSAIGGTRCPGGAVDLGTAPAVLADLLDRELDGRPATVAGVSLGAWMAVLLARERPDLVARLVLADAGGYADQDWERIERQVTLEEPSQARELLDTLYHRVPLSLRLARRGFYEAYTSRAVRSVLETTSESHVYADEDLAGIEAPTLVVWGESDRLFYPEVGEALARALPHARLEVLPRCGHAVHWECPAAFVDAIVRFAREEAPATPGSIDPTPEEERPWRPPSTSSA